MKVLLAHILMNYDCKLIEPEASRFFTWRSATLPKSKTMVAFMPL